ncbi:MFS transporter [Streptomyces sp. NPDC050560]|uniref:MFS transporter n=1 Tax=Streptomyces sp. NPDC050560 TaxID=3365630 RepID=UPI00379A66D3
MPPDPAAVTSAAPTSEPGRPGGRDRRWLALAVVATGMLMTVLDGSIVTVAMPSIAADLHFSPTGLGWVVNAYLIPFGGLLLLAGRLGDLLGRGRMLLLGMAVFTAASVLAGLAGAPWMLVAARALQGVGSAMASAVGLGILVTLFPGPGERARAIGVFAFTGSAGASLGQVLGGVLTDALDWHWIFFINLPVGVAALAVGARVLPRERGAAGAGGADVLGAVLGTGGLVLLIYAIVKSDQYGWACAHTLGLGAVALLLLAGFVLRQARAARPLMPLRLLRPPRVWGSYTVLMLMVAALFSFQIVLALHLQNVLGYGAFRTGVAMLPAALLIGAASLGLSARAGARFGEHRVLVAGLLLLVGMLALLTRLPVHAHYAVDVLPPLLLASGFGFAMPMLTSLAMSAAGPEDAGTSSGLFNTAQQVGMATGVAVLSTLAASRTARLSAGGAGHREALAGGYHLAFGVGACLVAVALAVTAVVLRRPARGQESVA